MFENYMNRMARQGTYMGQALKNQSDMIMDATFTNDVAYRLCYLQDKGTIFPEQTLDGYKKAKSVFAGDDTYDPSELKNFKPIDCKYLVKSYYSISGDAIDYYLQFRPNAHGENPNIRVGSFVFIPDDLGVYNLWLIVARDDKPQFPQFYILRCNLLLKWHIDHNEVIKFEGQRVDVGSYFSWCVQRTQSSYNSGVWTDYASTVVENQLKAWLPTNDDTDTLTYNERFVISASSRRRVVWETSKVENTTTWGLTKLTFAQKPGYDAVDNLSWINLLSDNYSDSQTGIDYDFYQERFNYELYNHNVEESVSAFSVESEMVENNNLITYSGVKPSLKVGGSYKTFTASLDVIGKPYWSIDYVYNGEVVCTLDFMYNGNNLICNDYYESFEIVDTNKVSYYQEGRKIFGIQFKYNNDKTNELKIKCQSVLDMIGNKLIIRAGNSSFETSACLEVEVEAL